MSSFIEKFTNLLQNPLIDAIANTIKKFKSSKNYWSVSSLILIFTLREAIAWKFGSAIRTFCETQAKSSDYATAWDIVGIVFDVGGSWELVLLGIFFFVGVSVVKVKAPESDEVITVVKDESKVTHEHLDEIKALIRLKNGDETAFLEKYFGKDYKTVVANSQTFHNFTTLLKNSNKTPNELLEEREELLNKIASQSLNDSIQKMIDKAFKELRYDDVRDLLDSFIETNQAIGDDLIKAHFQKALTYIKEIEYHKAKAEFEEFIPLGIKDAEILHEYGSLYYKLGEYDKSLEYNTKALVLNIENFGENHSSVAINYNAIGVAWYNKGAYDKAIEFHNKSLEIRLVTLGENHFDTAKSYNNIGLAWYNKGEYGKAIEFYNKSLKIKLANMGEKHPSTANTYNNIGLAWYGKEEYNKAIEFYNKALKIKLATLGKIHPTMATSYHNMAIVYYKMKKHQDAYDFMEKAVKTIEMKLPSTHPHLIESQRVLEMIKEKLKKAKN